MFDRPQPMPYTERKVLKRLIDLNRLSGISFTTHTLRKTCGSFMLSSGVSIEVVAEHLEHEDIQTTCKWYARMLNTKMAEAVRKKREFRSKKQLLKLFLYNWPPMLG